MSATHPHSHPHSHKPDLAEAPYYAKDGAVWKAPVKISEQPGSTTYGIGFKVCTMTDVVGWEAAESVAALMNAGETALSASQPQTPAAGQPEDALACIACGKPLHDGDAYYEDVNEGPMHAACCGPEPESFTGPDGEPLKPGDPIPAPGIYREPKDARPVGDEALREALDRIANPIKHMQAETPAGYKFDGHIALSLVTVEYLQDVARRAIAALGSVGAEEELPAGWRWVRVYPFKEGWEYCIERAGFIRCAGSARTEALARAEAILIARRYDERLTLSASSHPTTGPAPTLTQSDDGVRSVLTFSQEYHRNLVGRMVDDSSDGEALARVVSDAGLLHAALGTGPTKSFATDIVLAVRAALSAPGSAGPGETSLQARYQVWMDKVCEGDPTDLKERCARAAEEFFELMQALHVPASDLQEVMQYTYGRPEGVPFAEMGGAVSTLAALAEFIGFDMLACGEAELARVNTPAMIAKVRGKRSRRHGRGALPGLEADVILGATPSPAGKPDTGVPGERARIIERLDRLGKDAWVGSVEEWTAQAVMAMSAASRFLATPAPKAETPTPAEGAR